MICPFCKSNNLSKSKYYHNGKNNRLYSCRDCGFFGFPLLNKLESRKLKIEKIKQCIT